VTVVIALDDGEIVVIGTGTADIDVRVNDGATCGGCLAGEQCLVLADGTRQCTLPCSTGLDCSPSFECLTTFYRATADGSGAPVPTCDRAVAITAGSNHGCALLLSGGVRCFGKGVSGQLGDGRATSSADAVDVARIGNATAVDAAGNNTCAVLANGEVSCWGEAFGPVPYLLGGIGDAKAVALNEAGSVYVLRRNGSVSSFDGGGGWVPFPAATSTAISAGGTNFCWIQSDRKEFCLYQILDSTTSLNVGVDIQALDVGPLKICDVSVTGTVSCLGDGPIPIGPAASIGVGLQFACAAEKDGSLWCWGETGFLQLGSSAGATPVQVPSYSAVRSVAAGSGSVMTLDAAGHVAWGGDVFLADNLPVRLGTRAPVMGL
jgi:hypothetical protein